MGSYVQVNRKIRVSTPLGENALLLRAFSGTEEISRPFRFEIEMIAENRQKVAFDAVLGEKATVHLLLPDESTEQHFNGVCVRLGQAGRDENFTVYRAELVPEFQLLSRRTQSRIFQRMTVPEILKDVLKGVTVDWKIQGAFEKRDYCVQYRESDFAFASRLMEEEGVFYFFRHEEGKHTMVVANDSSAFPSLAGEDEIFYEELAGGVRDENRIWAWERSQEARSTRVVLWDHSFELPHKHLEAENPILDSVSAGRDTHKLGVRGSDGWELYDWPGAYAQRFDGVNRSGGEQEDELQKIFQDNARTVGIRMDEEASLAVTARGASNVKHFVAGHKLKLKRHFSSDGEYVLSSVTHRASYGADYRSGKEPLLAYENAFTCFPSALPFRPKRLTPRPVVPGSQTAVVVGPKGEEIFTDRYGRVKVQFHWDRKGKNDEDSSCWVRVGQLAAGRRWGASCWPRIGQEVIVDFLEGDPDQPIVVGTVYNADQMPPYLGQGPDAKHKNDNKVSGFKSNTTKGGQGFNEVRFDDAKDGEQVFVHAERNLDVRVKNDAMESILGDRHVTVGTAGEGGGGGTGDHRELVHRDVHLHNKRNLDHRVGGDLRLHVGGEDGAGDVGVKIEEGLRVFVDAAEDRFVGGERRTHVGGDDHYRTARDRVTKVEGNDATSVDRSRTDSVGGDFQISCAGFTHFTRRDFNVRAEGDATVLSDASAGVVASRLISLECGGSSIALTPSGVWITGAVVYINSGAGPSLTPNLGFEETPPSPLDPRGPADAAPLEPVAADDAKSGQKSG